MRRNLKLWAIFLVLSLVGKFGFSQWQKQHSELTEDKGMLMVDAVSRDVAYAVGFVQLGGQDTAVVMFTKNGGESWNMVAPGSGGNQIFPEIYLSVEFLDENTGLIGGWGKIFKTKNGGMTWNSFTVGTGLLAPLVTDIKCPERRCCYAVDSSGKLWISSDEGESWTANEMNLGGAQAGRIFFVTCEKGWAFGGKHPDEEDPNYSGGVLAVTEDGGNNWTVIFKDQPKAINSVYFVDEYWGWMVYDSPEGVGLSFSNDGGYNWVDKTVPTSRFGEVKALMDIYFFDKCEGMLIGNGENQGFIWATINGGGSWVEEVDYNFMVVTSFGENNVYAHLIDFDFVDRERGWLVGNYVTIFRYDAVTVKPECKPQIEDGGVEDRDGGVEDRDGDIEEGEEPSSRGCGCSILNIDYKPYSLINVIFSLLRSWF